MEPGTGRGPDGVKLLTVLYMWGDCAGSNGAGRI